MMSHGVWAAQLKDFSSKNEDKKIILHFVFSEPVVVDDEYYYDKNLVLLRIQGVTFTRDQLKHGYQAPAELADYLREVTYQQDKSEGQIRIYLGKLANPSDALVVKLDECLDIEVVKPTWKEPPAAEPAPPAPSEPAAAPEPEPGTADTPAGATFRDDAGSPAPEPEFIPDEPEPTTAEPAPSASATPPAEPSDAWEWGPPSDDTPAPTAEPEPAAAEPEPAPEPAPPGDETAPPDVYGETSISELPGTAEGETNPRPAEPQPDGSSEEAPTRPARDVTHPDNPPYTQFNLDQTPVAQVIIRGQPFREAILELVSGCGFNVVVGDDVDNTVLTLDFRNREISLKRALDILCVAYDLEYTVDADAIIFRAKP